MTPNRGYVARHHVGYFCKKCLRWVREAEVSGPEEIHIECHSPVFWISFGESIEERVGVSSDDFGPSCYTNPSDIVQTRPPSPSWLSRLNAFWKRWEEKGNEMPSAS